MVQETRYEKKIILSEEIENLNGKPIRVQITKCKQALEITVTNSKMHFCRHVIALAIFIFFNFLLLMNGIFSYIILIVSFVISFDFFYKAAFGVKQEKLLIFKSLGYQIESRYGLGESKLYIPWKDVKSAFINEVVSKQRVIFLLTLFTKESTKLIPLFTETLPRLHSLEVMYENIEICMS